MQTGECIYSILICYDMIIIYFQLQKTTWWVFYLNNKRTRFFFKTAQTTQKITFKGPVSMILLISNVKKKHIATYGKC